MGMDIYLHIEKRPKMVSAEKLLAFQTFNRHLATACRRNSKCYNKLKRIYKDQMVVEKFYQTRAHRYMQKCYARREAVYAETIDYHSYWLQTEHRLYERFLDLCPEQPAKDVFEGINPDDLSDEAFFSLFCEQEEEEDCIYVPIDILKQVISESKALVLAQEANEVVDERALSDTKRNIAWMEAIAARYTDEHMIVFSWWI